jgi:hypothetical protein
MASYVFNIAKGRVNELFIRVDNNEPANSAILLVPLKVTDTEANRQDDLTLSAFLAATPDEQTAGNWGRKTLTDAQLSAIAVDLVNNRFPSNVPETIWTPGPTTGNNTVGLLVAYDSDTTTGTDENVLPLVYLDFAVTADGNEIAMQPGDVFRAT